MTKDKTVTMSRELAYTKLGDLLNDLQGQYPSARIAEIQTLLAAPVVERQEPVARVEVAAVVMPDRNDIVRTIAATCYFQPKDPALIAGWTYDYIFSQLVALLKSKRFAEASATPVAVALPEHKLEAAAKTLAACMDYPWEQMPEQGRASMREHAKAVINAAKELNQ